MKTGTHTQVPVPMTITSIILRSHSEVEPVGSLRTPLDEEFIKVLLFTVGDIQQDGRVADGLFDAEATCDRKNLPCC